jgi:hypothetical protein
MCVSNAAVKDIHWGICPQAGPGRRGSAVLAWTSRTMACLIAVIRVAAADPVTRTAVDPPRNAPVSGPPATFQPTWDLDGTYLWLGPVGAASRVDARWDSTFGGDAAVVVVRERASLGLLGANLGASRWTARGGGRVWVDGLVGTHLLGRMMGISLGPIVELSALAHPRPGASIGVWCFAGITPFARLGTVANLGMFAELGIHIALPVLRR